jgi:hypothetical protein
MTCYLEYLVPKPYDRNQMNPDVFRTIYAAIQKAGDQGLSMDEISQVTGMPAASGLFFSPYLVAFYFNSETHNIFP